MSSSTSPQFPRRHILKGAALGSATAAAAALASSTASAQSSMPFGSSEKTIDYSKVPTSEETRQALVVGSGFGGAISAYRLGKAGVDTLVVERGKWWDATKDPNVFPRMSDLDNTISWRGTVDSLPGMPPLLGPKTDGLLEAVRGHGMISLVASGVGGGSIAYQGMSIQPSEENFRKAVSQTIDYGLLDADHYRRVEKMLKLAPIPDDVLAHPRYRSTQQMIDNGKKLNLDALKVLMPIDWNNVREELQGKRQPVYSIGDTIFGVNAEGKFSLDKTYIPAALATGHVELRTHSNVVDITNGANDTWIVTVDKTDSAGRVLSRSVITTKAVFMGAGAVNTTKMLVKAQATDRISRLPEGIGTRWGVNGERVSAVVDPLNSPGAYQGGPSCVAVKDWDNPAGPITIVTGPMPFPVDLATTTVIGIGISKPVGVWKYNEKVGEAELWWDNSPNRGLIDAIQQRIHSMYAGAATLIIDTNQLQETTFHPLGGVTFDSATDNMGRVHNQRGLYVMDGALIPGNAGAVNPSMTIAALAEHAMDNILATDRGTVF